MNDTYSKHESEYIKKYQEKGFVVSYIFDGSNLIDTTTKKKYTPKDIYIVAENRFEGMSNPSDMSILYVIKTKDGSKGTVLVGFGPSSDLDLSAFFKDVPLSQYTINEDLL